MRLPPFIATLATLVGLRSFAWAICENVTKATLGGSSSYALAVSNSGEIVGGETSSFAENGEVLEGIAIDSSGMLMDATGEPVAAVGDSFVVHMDREALNAHPLGLYDVTVKIISFEPDREIA